MCETRLLVALASQQLLVDPVLEGSFQDVARYRDEGNLNQLLHFWMSPFTILIGDTLGAKSPPCAVGRDDPRVSNRIQGSVQLQRESDYLRLEHVGVGTFTFFSCFTGPLVSCLYSENTISKKAVVLEVHKGCRIKFLKEKRMMPQVTSAPFN